MDSNNTIPGQFASNNWKNDSESLDDDSARLVVLGEASMLSTAILRGTQRSSGSLRSASGSVPSRLASMVVEYEEYDDDDETIADPLLKSLIRLKAKLRKDKLVVTDPNYLRPFCDVIKNKDVSGPVTGLALQSILKFINYGIIKSDDNGVQMIADSVTKARFVGTDTSSDEVVLMRILNVLRELIVRRFSCLSNGAVCEIMQSCFKIAFEPRLSELLRKCSEQALVDMVHVLFRRIPEFTENNINGPLDCRISGKFNSIVMKKQKFSDKTQQNKHRDETKNETYKSCYGLECIHELITYLTSLINPLPDAQNSESMTSVGLTLLTVAFETSVHGIGGKQCLMSTVKNDLSWNIMLLLQNDRPLNSYAASLRLAFLIFTNLRMHLKYQFEALLIRLMDIITTGNAPLEYREIAHEYLVAFFRHLTHLPHEIFLNYDCDPYASNLLDDLLQLFSKNCFATLSNNQQLSVPFNPNVFSSIQILSLDALLASLKSLQKAELCNNELLIPFPAATFVMENISVLPNNEDFVIIPEKRELYKQESGISECSSPPEDVDVGIVSCDSIESVEPTDNGSKPDIQNENKENDRIEESKVNIKYRSTVSYTFPRPEKVPTKITDIDHYKQRKRLLWMASDQFNLKPAKGIQYLYENSLASDDKDIVMFFRDNPKLDKKQIGEYLSNKKNLKVLQSFVESFAFRGVRIDDALRIYLESFRLPGEAPLISLVLEHFAHHWHESNNCPFVNEDAAFSLAYAIIMLNVDQHNTNVKRQTNPMTCEEFIANLRQVNGGKDFDPEMLRDIYFMIRTNEIIMPAEQHGIVRERYLWKCLLRNSETENGIYWFKNDETAPFEQNRTFEQIFDKNQQIIKDEKFRVKLSTLNGPIFSVLWGPTVAAMTFIFDKINPDQHSGLSRRILNNGFNSCALLCATYGHLDNLIVSLSKFILSSSNSSSPIMTIKSQHAAQCLFSITREYSNEMRESWSNIIELILHWYTAKLLDNTFEFEDFALNSKKIMLNRKETKPIAKNINDAGSTFLSSFYSYFAGNQQNDITNNQGNNDQSNGDVKSDSGLVMESNGNNSNNQLNNTYSQPLMLIIEDSKFLHIDSLLELIKALINVHLDNTEENDYDIEIFKLEILLQIILMNRDRVSVFWPQVSRYLLRLIRLCPKNEELNDRVTSAIFRLAIRFVPRPDCLSEQIFHLLCHILVTFEPSMIQRKSTAIALHSFVTHCHGYISKSDDWSLIFDLLLYIGIGYRKRLLKSSETNDGTSKSDHEDNSESVTKAKRGYTSDSEIDTKNASVDQSSVNLNSFRLLSTGANGSSISYRILDLEAYEKCTEILTLIIREILPNNIQKFQNKQNPSNFTTVTQQAVTVLQNFVEASVKIQMSPGKSGQLKRSVSHYSEIRKYKTKSRAEASSKSRLSRFANAILSSSESEGEDDVNDAKSEQNKSQPKLSSVTETCSLKLLDLMHYLHLNAALTIQNDSSDFIWSAVWCPLLQGMALFCCDSRRPVRTCALTFLQRALLLHDLRILSASQWENCFNKILFPLLSKLLEPLNMYDPIGMDETRMRTTNLLCKVFLQHLTPLLSLPTFTALWLTILDFMDKYIKAEMQTDLVREAIPESLKNILLVMDTAGCFNDTLAAITWDRIAIFLPNLRNEIMPPQVEDSAASSKNINTANESDDPKRNAEPKPHLNPQQQSSQTNFISHENVPHSTFINIDDYPKIPYAHTIGPIPGSSVMTPSIPIPSQTAFFPQQSNSSAYPWPAPSDSKIYPSQ